MSEMDVPRSPCISVCVLDDADICIGCFRSAVEITDWSMVSVAEKRAILERCHQRQQAAQLHSLS
ncbi:MAG: DUF1289 domain-containing protein [Parahaliea sp.]